MSCARLTFTTWRWQILTSRPTRASAKRFVSEHYCPACHARDGIDRSQLSLLTTSLALLTIRDQYLRGHGLCVDHAIKTSDSERTGLVKQPGDVRLAVLGWELEETARTYAWACRHESSGPERHACLRAAAQINGHVFQGARRP